MSQYQITIGDQKYCFISDAPKSDIELALDLLNEQIKGKTLKDDKTAFLVAMNTKISQIQLEREKIRLEQQVKQLQQEKAYLQEGAYEWLVNDVIEQLEVKLQDSPTKQEWLLIRQTLNQIAKEKIKRKKR